jgi:iron complex transport system ATP-binding protein
MSETPAVLRGEALGAELARRVVLEGVDIAVPAGCLLGVLGPNGAGKSTLLTVLAGLLVPRSGGVTLAGHPLATMPLRERARRIAYLPQSRIVHWPLSVREVVALGRLAHSRRTGRLGPEDRRAVELAMAETGLEALHDRPVDRLSGGELARVLLARALAQGGDVLIADEPTSGLDPAYQLDVMARLAAIATAGKAVVVALHDLSLAARFCHSVVLLSGGRSVAAGRPAEVLDAARLAEVFGIRAHCCSLDGVPIVLPLGLAD